MTSNRRLRLDLSTVPDSKLPWWIPWAALVMVVVGLGASGYLAYEHYSAETTLSCPNEGGLNCEKVTSSEQSTLFGIPVALLGMAYFVAMLIVVLPPTWRFADAMTRRLFTLARLAAVGGGIVYVLYLVYAELFVIDSICIWCTVVHVVAFILFVLVAFGTALAAPEQEPDR
ncbi:MAG: vitamin K epoxide reductase family protein [Micromonosporaceae bacterium]|nr:vitamin K epoxide reductase family protein [Micromonosporaceae bacterium]